MTGDTAEDAAVLMASAEKHSKKKLFRRPDWDTAASEYEKAAKILTFLEDTSRATDAWRKTSGAHEKAGNKFFAARAMENLAVFLLEQVRKGIVSGESLIDSAVEAYCEASKLYALNEMFDRQADCLKKAAEILSPTHKAGLPAVKHGESKAPQEGQEKMQRVMGFFRDGVEVLEENVDDKPVIGIQLPELYRCWMLAHLHSGDVKGAVEVLEQELGIRTSPRKKGIFERLSQTHKSAKAGLEIVVLCLSCGDDVWARQEMNKLKDVPGFDNSKEERTANALIFAFEERDEEQLREAIKDQTLQFITIDISRMSKKLKLRFSAPQEAPAGTSSHPYCQQQEQQNEEEKQQDLEIDPEEDIR